MSYIRFHLHNPRGEDDSYIRARIKLKPGKYHEFYLTGEKIAPHHWNSKTNRARKNYSDHRGLNTYLDKVQIHFNNVRRNLHLSGLLNKFEMKKAVNEFYSKSNQYELYNVFDKFIKEKENNPSFSSTMGRKYKNVRDKLHSFDPNATFESISINFIMNWVNFLYSEFTLSPNTVKRYVGFLRTMLNEATDRGFNKNMAYKSRAIKIKGTKSLYPFLSTTELDIIYKKKITDERLHNAKIELLKGCYSGLRHSDWHKLKLDKITKIDDREYFVINNQKTRHIVYIPAFDRLKTLAGMPSVSRSLDKTNDAIKDLCEYCDIDQPWTKYTYGGNKPKTEVVPKYKAVSTHIARRSFACNSLIKGVPRQIIMKVGGWETEKAFNQYIQLSSLDGLEHFDNIF